MAAKTQVVGRKWGAGGLEGVGVSWGEWWWVEVGGGGMHHVTVA